MRRIDQYFDRTGTVKRPPYAGIIKEFRSFLTAPWNPPDPAGLPNGNGHVVLVIPGVATADSFTRQLREFLTACGYRAFGWGLGVNWGPTERVLLGLRHRVQEFRRLEDGPISVVGVSLGGMMARHLAYDHPRDIRHVVTLASPFRLPTATVLEPLFQVCSLFYSEAMDPARLAQPLPVPSTAFFTRDDGLVAWESCRIEAPDCQVVEVSGAHTTICRNPEVLRIVARALDPSR